MHQVIPTPDSRQGTRTGTVPQIADRSWHVVATTYYLETTAAVFVPLETTAALSYASSDIAIATS
eukprot:scaffold94990_cov25-Prasinocladus_malaysianus.AAC.1